MATINNLNSFIEASQEMVVHATYKNSWTMTSYLIQILHKMDRYTESLTEANHDTDFFTANIAIQSALNLISNTYEVPATDERFELVQALYEATVNDFIQNKSDDACVDLVYLGRLANFVANMRTYAWSDEISENGPSEDKFEALKLAKRDEKAVEIAIDAAADAIFAD